MPGGGRSLDIRPPFFPMILDSMMDPGFIQFVDLSLSLASGISMVWDADGFKWRLETSFAFDPGSGWHAGLAGWL